MTTDSPVTVDEWSEIVEALTDAIEGQNLYHGRHGTTPAGSATASAIVSCLRNHHRIDLPALIAENRRLARLGELRKSGFDVREAAERHVADMLSAYLMTDEAGRAANDVIARLFLSGFDIVRHPAAALQESHDA